MEEVGGGIWEVGLRNIQYWDGGGARVGGWREMKMSGFKITYNFFVSFLCCRVVATLLTMGLPDLTYCTIPLIGAFL